MQSENLFNQLAGSLERGDKPALTEGARVTSYADLASMIDRFAGEILTKTESGAVVGIQAPSRSETLAALYACFRTGRTAVCVPARNGDFVIQDAGATLILTEPSDFSRADFSSETPPRDPAVIVYTSGSTGKRPKGVLVSHRGIGDAVQFMNRTMMVDDTISQVLVAPIDHLYAIGRCHAALRAGGTVHFAPGIGAIFDLLQQGANALAIVPSVLATLIKDHEAQLRAVGQGVRWAEVGSMRFDIEYRRRMLEIFPNARIFRQYGLSEAMRATFLNLREKPDKIHTEGRPRPGVKIEILDGDGQVLPAGQKGEIWVSGEALALGYTDDALWQARIRDGRYHTGDLGLLDEDGYLVFLGRSDDIVNVNGNLVHPAEVEADLAGLFAQPICVVGVADPRGVRDTVLVVCVEGATPVRKKDVAAHMAGAARHLVPEYLVSLQAFPRTATGKIRRPDLARDVTKLI